MKQPKLLCLYHPTTVVFVDDDPLFLKKVTFNLDAEILYKTYQDAEEALKYIRALKNQNKLHAHTISQDIGTEGLEDGHPLNLKISNIFHEAYEKNQFEEVSVVVVDSSMPKLSGTEFFDKITDIPIKKIMLTGQADETHAVKLFNSGTINKFMRKGEKNLDQIINPSIHELQNEYFQDVSNIILGGLTINKQSCLNDPIFTEFFYKLCSENSVSSYYLIDTSGSFLFLDNKGSASWLLVSSESEAKESANQAAAEGAPKEIVDSIREGKQMVYFCKFDDYVNATEGNWENYLYQTIKIQGNEEYRYSLTKDLKGFPLNKNKIISLNEYTNLKK